MNPTTLAEIVHLLTLSLEWIKDIHAAVAHSQAEQASQAVIKVATAKAPETIEEAIELNKQINALLMGLR